MPWNPENSSVRRVDADPDAVAPPLRIPKKERVMMQPMGDMKSVARRPSVANRGTHKLDMQGCGDDSLSSLDDSDNDLTFNGGDKHLVQMASENPDLDLVDFLEAGEFLDAQEAQWTNLDVWD